MNVAQITITWRPEFSIYAAESFLKSVGDEYGWLGGTDGSGKLRCVLPYTIIRKFPFRMVRFRVETIPLGGELAVEEERSFIEGAMTYFRGLGVDLVLPASTNTLFSVFPSGAEAAPYGSYIIDLEQPEDVLWSKLHSKHRNVVRNAQKRGVVIRMGTEHLATAHKLISDTLQRSRLGFMSLPALKRFVAGLGENVRVVVAEHEGIAQGCAIIPYSLHSAYYLYAGSIPEPLTGAMNLLTWEAMRLFSGLGVRRYDFVGVRINPEEGSKQHRLKAFKERFGGKLQQGYIWKLGFNRIKYWAYGVAVRLRNGGDIVDQERHKLAVAESPRPRPDQAACPAEK